MNYELVTEPDRRNQETKIEPVARRQYQGRSTNPPTSAQATWAETFLAELDDRVQELEALLAEPVRALNDRVREAGIELIGGPAAEGSP